MQKVLIYLMLAFLTMSLGLLSRASFIDFPVWVNLYLGDFLWALMVFWFVCALKPKLNNTLLVALALIFTFSIEFSQLYQAAWINDIRFTKLGGLILGFGFKWSDLLAYTLGVTTGGCVNYLFIKDRSVLLIRE